MVDPYERREQTEAKHFILRRYLQALSNKLLHGNFKTLTYVDGFSGPWNSNTPDYSDTSFMIAIEVLKDAQSRVRSKGMRKRVQCFFVEESAANYAQLVAAVAPHHDPANDFFIYTRHGRFVDSVDDIMKVVGTSFALTFIDPTGWTGYEFPNTARIMAHKPGEVLLNYMKSFIDRFTAKDTHKNATFEGILGDEWQDRLDPDLPRDEAVQALFNEQFAVRGNFKYVVSTPIEKLQDRTAFCIVYGTRTESGLETYREEEFRALRNHGMRRIQAKRAKEAARTGIDDLFTAAGIVPDAPIEQQVPEFCRQAREWLVAELQKGGPPRQFGDIWPQILKSYTVRKTNAKDICVALANDGIIKPSWRDRGTRIRTPDDTDLIELA